jgi:hypothetical protein
MAATVVAEAEIDTIIVMADGTEMVGSGLMPDLPFSL